MACCLAGLLSCPPAFGQEQSDPQKVPAAWVGREPGTGGQITGLVDLRGFYHGTNGVGSRRPDWSGTELLSYFDAAEGLSGAFVLRHEVRDQVAYYGTLMLIPKIRKDMYVVSSLGVGNGADFQPVTRMDGQLRGFLAPKIMYDVGGYATWWTQNRRQLAQSDALILWYNPYIIELRASFHFTQPGFGDWRTNFMGTAVFLYGAHKHSWLMARLTMGTEPENAPGLAFADTRDLLVVAPAVGYRKWFTPSYGAAVEAEFYYQYETWYRFGGIASVFASF